jgi:hypothetical protein
MILGEYAEVSQVVDRRGRSDAALRAGAWCWAAVMLIGQWLFVYYLVAMYGGSTLSGRFEAWNRSHLIKGYIAGDTPGNVALAVHILVATIVWLGGVLQLVPQIRERAIWFHKWNGRVFAVAALAASIDGLYMVWVRGAAIELVGSLSVSLDAVLILAFVAVAWRAALAGDIDRHRRWALRAFMVVNAVYFVRVLVFGWLVVTGGAGMTKVMDGPMNYFLPLGVLELYLRARASARRVLRFAAALVLLLAIVYMGAGTVALTMSKFGRLG